MADNTKIEWADATVNYLNGCSVISAGCTNCYAMRLAGTRMKHHPSRAGLTMDTKAGPVWTGETRANEKALLDPLGWKRPRRIFWNAHGDLFHESVPDAVIDRQWAVMALTPQHTHMVLTKRPERMREYASGWLQRRSELALADLGLPGRTDDLLRLASAGGAAAMDALDFHHPLPNVWLGISVEDQRAADERIPHLLATPAAVRFLSCEPLLGPVDLRNVDYYPFLDSFAPRENPADPNWPQCVYDTLAGHMKGPDDIGLPKLDWVIAGGESGPGARPMHPDWARSLRDQCAAAGVAFHFKQWGEWGRVADQRPAPDHLPQDADTLTRCGKARAGRLLDGRTHDEFPGAQPAPITAEEVPY